MKQSIITEMLGCAILWFIIKHNKHNKYDGQEFSVFFDSRCIYMYTVSQNLPV